MQGIYFLLEGKIFKSQQYFIQMVSMHILRMLEQCTNIRTLKILSSFHPFPFIYFLWSKEWWSRNLELTIMTQGPLEKVSLHTGTLSNEGIIVILSK